MVVPVLYTMSFDPGPTCLLSRWIDGPNPNPANRRDTVPSVGRAILGWSAGCYMALALDSIVFVCVLMSPFLWPKS